MNVRAKFVVSSVTKSTWNPSARTVTLSAVCADDVPENQRYHRYTPSGQIEMQIDNPPVAEFFEASLGKSFYVDFTPASA